MLMLQKTYFLTHTRRIIMDEDLKKELEAINKAVNEKLAKQADDHKAVIKAMADDVDAIKVSALKTSADDKEANGVLKADIEALNAKLAELPNVETAETKVEDTFTYEKAANGNLAPSAIEMKAVTSNTDIAGSGVGVLRPYFPLLEMNPIRGLAMIYNAVGSTFKIPKVGGGLFVDEAVQPADARNAGGSIGSTNATLKEWACEDAFSTASLEEVMALDATIIANMQQGASFAEAKQGFQALKAGNFASIKTGVAAKLPTSENIIAKLADLVAALDTAYLPMAKFLVSRGALAVIQSSNNNGLNFNATTGITTIFGYPVCISGYGDTGNTANDESVYFGDFMKGLVLASGTSINIGRFEQTRPGSITYFARFKSVTVAHDLKALVAMKSSA